MPSNEKIISLAVDLWRLEEKINNIKTINENETDKINASFNRIKRFINECKIVVTWYNWEKYSEDVNVYELKWTELTEDLDKNDIIKDTIEPAVFVDGQLMKTGKIIVYKINS